MEFFYSTSSPFSQFHPARFTVNYDIGTDAATDQKIQQVFHFTSAEQAMMFGKAMLFGDTEYANKILAASTPLEAKQLGRKVRGFSGEVWDQHKQQIVYQNNKAKFTQNPHMLGQLMATGDRLLVEASPRDTIWGVGLDVSNPKIHNRATWRGQNLLGYILTQLRNDLRWESQKTVSGLVQPTISQEDIMALTSTNQVSKRQTTTDLIVSEPANVRTMSDKWTKEQLEHLKMVHSTFTQAQIKLLLSSVSSLNENEIEARKTLLGTMKCLLPTPLFTGADRTRALKQVASGQGVSDQTFLGGPQTRVAPRTEVSHRLSNDNGIVQTPTSTPTSIPTPTPTPTTKVVNVKVACIRPTYQNLAEWIADPNNVYIGRRGVVFVENSSTDGKKIKFPPTDSPFANPFKIATDRVANDGSRDEVILKYEVYIRERLAKEPELRMALEGLRGKTLGCWCVPEPCHGDVLVKILQESA